MVWLQKYTFKLITINESNCKFKQWLVSIVNSSLQQLI